MKKRKGLFSIWTFRNYVIFRNLDVKLSHVNNLTVKLLNDMKYYCVASRFFVPNCNIYSYELNEKELD